MDKLKQWVALTAVGCLAVLAAGWFLVVSPKRAEADDLATQASAQQSKNAGLRQQLAVLKSQAKSLPQQQARLAAVAAKIPDNPALPALIRALDTAADAAGVELVSITPSAPTALTAGTTPVAPTGVIAPARAGATSATTGLLSSIGVTVNVVGGYFEMEQFLDALESLPRAFKVTAFTAAPGTNPVKPPPAAPTGTAGAPTAAPAAAPTDDGRILTATVTGQVFLAAGRAAATPVTVPVTPGVPAPKTAAAPAPVK